MVVVVKAEAPHHSTLLTSGRETMKLSEALKTMMKKALGTNPQALPVCMCRIKVQYIGSQ
jgi:hypothetical protein